MIKKLVTMILFVMLIGIMGACKLNLHELIDGPSATSTTTTTTTTSTTVPQDPASLVAEGRRAFGRRHYSNARAKFTAALAVDPSYNEAKVWKALLDLAYGAVDSDVVSLMRDYLGISGYPDDLETLFSYSWFTEQWYSNRSGFIVADEDSNVDSYFIRGNLVNGLRYEGYYEYETGDYLYQASDFLPSDSGRYLREYDAESVPAGYVKYIRLQNFADASNPMEFLLPAMRRPEWADFLGEPSVVNLPVLAIANVIQGNQAGFDALLEHLLSGVYSNGFDTFMTTIRALPVDFRITIPAAIYDAYGVPSPGFDIQVGKSELLALASTQVVMKSLVQLLSSYEWNYPLALGMFDYMDVVFQNNDADRDGLSDIVEAILDDPDNPGPFVSQLLKDRSQARRSAAKITMLQAMDDVIDSAELFISGLRNGDYSDIFAEIPDAPSVLTLADEIEDNLFYATDVRDAVAANSRYSIPDSVNYFFPGEVFESDIFNIRRNLEYDAITDLPKWYKVWEDSQGNEVISTPGMQGPSGYTWVNIGMKGTFEGVKRMFPSAGGFSYPTGSNAYLRLVRDDPWDESGLRERFVRWMIGAAEQPR